ncbi:hypothetical protein T484DRAFT_1824647 [Baffinella frigidus]|nr:hypothetical protein T484DRAFT_1824647 [Cryptophyta sp. CCMP2293]
MARACVALALALAAFAAIVVPSLSFSALPSPHMALRRGCAAPRQGFFCTSGSRSLTFNQHQLKVVVRASLDGTIGGEVTLLKVVFEESSVEELRAWVRRFPFAAVLPVQPMSAFPSDTGVDVQFRKNPTSEEKGKDGR